MYVAVGELNKSMLNEGHSISLTPHPGAHLSPTGLQYICLEWEAEKHPLCLEPKTMTKLLNVDFINSTVKHKDKKTNATCQRLGDTSYSDCSTNKLDAELGTETHSEAGCGCRRLPGV